MILEHIAIWTNDIENLKNYYCRYFNADYNKLYVNKKKKFKSYFLSFNSGARLEIMSMEGVPDNENDTINRQHLGIIHIAFGVESREQVDAKAAQLQADGFPVLSGPRVTGDGYYEFETLDPDNNRIEVTCKA